MPSTDIVAETSVSMTRPLLAGMMTTESWPTDYSSRRRPRVRPIPTACALQAQQRIDAVTLAATAAMRAAARNEIRRMSKDVEL